MEEFTPHKFDDLPQIINAEGYVLVRLKTHPLVQSNGYISRSRLVMENKLGRYLSRSELVYHSDHNPQNDDPDNLTLDKPRVLPVLTCAICKKEFQQTNARIRFCSPKCGAIATRRCPHPAPDMLQWLVWDRPTSALSKFFGVSDVAIGKWCRRLGVKKPGRGYWAKVYAGKIAGKNPYKKPRRVNWGARV